MLRALLLFGVGYWLGGNKQAGKQLVSAGQQLLDATTGQPVTTTVLPDTKIVSPEKVQNCPDGYTWWPQYKKCLDPKTDTRLRNIYNSGKPLPDAP